MAKLAKGPELDDMSLYTEAYRGAYSGRFNNIREAAPHKSVWDTDPSIFSRYHIQEGASFAATELCYIHSNVCIGSARGTTKAYNANRWVGINSFECQAYGGLETKDHHIDNMEIFEQQREAIWWITQGMLYLGGARTIYSESGVLSHHVTIQRDFNDPH